MNTERVRNLNEGYIADGTVAYWMSRDQRVNDNWALIYAQKIALEKNCPLVVLFCRAPEFLNATFRQYKFMLSGLKEVEENLSKLNISFFLVSGDPVKSVVQFVAKKRISHLVTDFDPLSIKRKWQQEVTKNISIPFYEVDAHNIVPCWIASPKQEFGAYTIRKKIQRLLPYFLEEFPTLKKQNARHIADETRMDWNTILESITADRNLQPIQWIAPGAKEAETTLNEFISKKIHSYNACRNDPALDCQSNLSPYLHFGQLSAQRVALEVIRRVTDVNVRQSFLEELIIRRELSDNFCFYNRYYDSFDGFPEWARKTLNNHRKDIRPYMYSIDEFERGKTHDELWNAAQLEMVKKGKMHGYMRMYWAKKILEWSKSPEKAMEAAIYLNDRYGLDGRDANGYTGIAWSIGGVHDRAWAERDIFGKIRYMSYNGCKAKFNIRRYVEYVQTL